ncbi:DUF2388 domain-containing protein [Bdellovibrio sp. SKB1291214]|uniref:DUF2388 domain-containing protein n=1 Tax=Bdellovibrio sp. SKB1291214 TaxID=1732569 RepID=UPI000B5151D5|nr:DUF2388 domain-containing protein [Bdellovibrio sp. SKB1291214]UYL08795.1 DUF2388 domain-containing protein [Bdellovibrio sp. SKB1291214]
MFRTQFAVIAALTISSVSVLALDNQDATRAGFAATTMAPLWTIVGPFITTKNAISPEQYKMILAAKDDAAVFVGTGGEIRNVRLQRALELVRQAAPSAPASDLEIAEAIVAL